MNLLGILERVRCLYDRLSSRSPSFQAKFAHRPDSLCYLAASLKISTTATLILMLILGTVASASHRARRSVAAQNQPAQTESNRPKYQINLELDFEQRSYKGSERVRWTNHGDHATSSLFFHLYANVRADQQPPVPATN